MKLTNTKYRAYPSEEMIRPTVRPLPYFGAYAQSGERELAASLRRDFVPLLARRLPDHHLVGQRHGAVPAFVAVIGQVGYRKVTLPDPCRRAKRKRGKQRMMIAHENECRQI